MYIKKMLAILFVSSAAILTPPSVIADPLTKVITVYLDSDSSKQYEKNQVKQAIMQGAQLHHWMIVENPDESFSARLQVRTYVVDVKITFDKKRIYINYVSSENLDYIKKADGSEHIQAKYDRWVTSLRNDIKFSLNNPTQATEKK